MNNDTRMGGATPRPAGGAAKCPGRPGLLWAGLLWLAIWSAPRWAGAQCSSGPALASSYASNNTGGGIMFDITTTTALTLRSFDVNLSASGNFAVYTKAGPSAGFETSAASWTLVGSTSAPVATLGINTPTPLPIALNLALAAGQTVGIYIAGVGGSSIRYVNGTGYTAVASDANLSIMGGSGRSTGDAFTVPAIYYRNFSGTVHYTLGTAPIIDTFTPASASPGAVVTVAGTNFGGLSAVSLNGAAVTVVGTPTATSFSFVVGPASTTGPLSLTASTGSTTTPCSFTVLPSLLVSSWQPRPNARRAPTDTVVALTLSQPLANTAATTGALKVFSSQLGGRRQQGTGASTTVSGSTLRLNPTTDFRPGETVFVTLTTAAQATAGHTLRGPQVRQFTTATGGTGRGNFQPPATLPSVAVGTSPNCVAVGDVDGDGDLDLVTANADATVNVRLNGGDATGSNTGAFSNGSSSTVGSAHNGLALGDVDGDGDLDLLLVNTVASGTVSVLLNGGDATGSNTGTFSGGSTVSVGNTPRSLALGDVDGDGDLDLLTANSTANTVSVRLNGGDATGSNTGTFAGGSNLTVGSRPWSLALGDVDGDGDLDFVTANFNANTVSVRLNGGDATGSNTGAFSGGSTVSVGTSPAGVALGDVDADGDLDLLTANSTANTVSVRLNGGDATGSNTGAFAGGSTPAVDSLPLAVVLADVDADGDLDLLTANNGGSVSLRLNGGNAAGAGTGLFSNGSTVSMGSATTSLALGDVDGDGDLDLLTARNTSSTAGVHLNLPPAPTLTALSPAAELPGQVVTLTGTSFVGGSTVTFGGVAAASVTFVSATSLTAVVPAGAAPGSSAVVVSTPSGSSPGSPAFEVLQVYRSTAASGCLSSDPLTLSGAGGAGAWRYLRLPAGQGGGVVAAIEDTRNLGTVVASLNALGTATAAAVRQDGRAGRRYLDRNFFLTATNPSFAGQTVRVRLFGLTSELARLTAVDANATLATLNASQYDGANVNCQLADNASTGERRLLAAPVTTVAGTDWFTAQLTVADHFSEFYLTGASSPLPVVLTSFTATAEGAAAHLRWATASEKNSLRFDIERSPDGRRFATIGQVAAAGTTARGGSYAFRDDLAPAGLSYYRLRQLDLDGASAYSPVRAVVLPAAAALPFTVFPNPARAALAVAGLGAGAPVLVLDALGRPVATATADGGGAAQLRLPAGLAPGLYVVRSGAQVQRLVVE